MGSKYPTGCWHYLGSPHKHGDVCQAVEALEIALTALTTEMSAEALGIMPAEKGKEDGQ